MCSIYESLFVSHMSTCDFTVFFEILLKFEMHVIGVFSV